MKRKEAGSQKRGKTEIMSMSILLIGKFSKKTILSILKTADGLYDDNGFTTRAIPELVIRKMKSKKYNFILISEKIFQDHEEIIKNISKKKKVKVLIEDHEHSIAISEKGIEQVIYSHELQAIVNLEGYRILKKTKK